MKERYIYPANFPHHSALFPHFSSLFTISRIFSAFFIFKTIPKFRILVSTEILLRENMSKIGSFESAFKEAYESLNIHKR